MSIATLLKVMASQPKEAFFSGGEATLRGLAFFRLAQECSPKTEFHLQSNGILIDEEWVSFFAEHGWIVGLSTDGPHGQRGGDLRAPERAAEAFRAAGVVYTIICTVTRSNVLSASEAISCLAEQGEYLSFIPAKPRWVGDTEFTVTGEEYRDFMAVIASEVHPGGVEVAVRQFQEARAAWMRRPLSCEQTTECGTYLRIDPDGSVTPCDFAGPEWRLGSVWDDVPLGSFLSHPKMAEFRAKKRIPTPECESCGVIQGCHRGCPASRFLVAGDFTTLDPHCEARKFLAEITRPRCSSPASCSGSG